MARDWVKLHTCMTRDPDINELPAEHGWNWTRMLALAGDCEDNGRIGDARSVAYVLRVSEASVLGTVAALDGRIEERDGELYFRDWADWQTASNKERQATFREAHRNGVSHDVTGGNEGNLRARARIDQQEQQEQQDTPVGKPAAPRRAPAKPSTEQQAVFGALCDWLELEASGLPVGTSATIGKLAAVYVKAKEGPEAVQADASRWRREDWRGRDGQRPTTVKQAQDWRAHCRKTPNGNKPHTLVSDDWTDE